MGKQKEDRSDRLFSFRNSDEKAKGFVDKLFVSPRQSNALVLSYIFGKTSERAKATNFSAARLTKRA